MGVLKKTDQILQSSEKKVEIKFNARAVSRGISIGKAVCLHGNKRQFYRFELKDTQIEGEVRRFRQAARLAKSQLRKIADSNGSDKNQSKNNIFDTHLLILEDKSLIEKIENFIAENQVNAEWAVKIITDSYIADYKTVADEHLRERYIDLEDIAERLLTALGGGKQNFYLEKDSIIVAREIKPSTLIELAESSPKAIVTERGGWTSHAFILARELNLPAVTGVKDVLRRVKTGDDLVVDGFNGQVIFNPSEKTSKRLRVAAEFRQTESEQVEASNEKLKTLDGREIIIRANVDLPKGYIKAKQSGAKGVGLYRSEFLFNQNKGFPSEQEQIEVYRSIAKLVGDDIVKIRTFDLSIEQISEKSVEDEKNSALGLRGIRLSLANTKQFRIQLRALLQAANRNNIDVVLPMISDISEVFQAKKILENEKSKLRKKNIPYGQLRLGVMVEVPATILMAEELAAEVDFLCLGTNDLVQYLLAVDRDNETVAEWFRTLHPAVIRSIKKIIIAAENARKPLIICGEMAGSPVYAALLVGLGARELSMNLNSIPRVRKTIAGIAFEEAAEICKKIDNCRTSDEVENAVSDFFQKKWSHLFSADNLPPRKNNR